MIGVLNRLVIVPHPVKPEVIRTAIQQALERHAQHEARHIDVRVEDGVVILDGNVGSSTEKRAVVGMVSDLRGIRAVSDRLTVAP